MSSYCQLLKHHFWLFRGCEAFVQLPYPHIVSKTLYWGQWALPYDRIFLERFFSKEARARWLKSIRPIPEWLHCTFNWRYTPQNSMYLCASFLYVVDFNDSMSTTPDSSPLLRILDESWRFGSVLLYLLHPCTTSRIVSTSFLSLSNSYRHIEKSNDSQPEV